MVEKNEKTVAHEKEMDDLLQTGGKWTKRVNVDMPIWAIKGLDLEADRRGITRQALIKIWLVDRLDLLREKSLI
jgi:hypothetical protein